MDPPGADEAERATAVEYEPVSVKAVLAEMKDTAELLVDLAYSAVLLSDPAIAREVVRLEDRMDVLQLRAQMSLLVAARSPEDAEALAPVLGVVGAAESISDAAGDVAEVVLGDIGLPDAMRAALPEAVETLVRAEVAADSPLTEATLGELNLETGTGVRVIAVRHGDDGGSGGGDGGTGEAGATGDRDGVAGEWNLDPDRDTRLRAGDVALLRGPEDGVEAVYEDATGEPYAPPAAGEPAVADLERAVDAIVLMKDTSELAVDLAYGAVLFDSSEVAEEVAALEAEVDALQTRLEAWTLRAAARVDDPVALRGLVRLAASAEVISDAALDIGEGVLRGLGPHPVVAEAVGESDEVFVRETVAAGSALDGTTVGERALRTETGMTVIAVRRAADGGSEWVVSPGPDTRLAAGDVLMAKGTRAGAERLQELCS